MSFIADDDWKTETYDAENLPDGFNEMLGMLNQGDKFEYPVEVRSK